MFLKSFWIRGIVGIGIIFCFWVRPLGVVAFFSLEQKVVGNQLEWGDWEAPELFFTKIPEESITDSKIKIELGAKDNHSLIGGIEYTLYSGERNDPSSDWVKVFRSTACLSGACAEKEENFILEINLDFIDNPNHYLCANDSAWCADQPMPSGNYYLVVRSFDQSQTVNPEGNLSEPLFLAVEKKTLEVVCLPSFFEPRVAAGEAINFPAVDCQGELSPVEIRWDLDSTNGIDWDHPDLLGVTPVLEAGYLIPGTYNASVWGISELGTAVTKNFQIDVTNPPLVYQSLLINEILPNPVGEDAALAPGGEWVEIFNPQSTAIDLLGFFLYDTYDTHELAITKENVADGKTIILPGEHKVVYRFGSPIFSLNNQGPEKVRLFNGFLENGALLLDQVTYENFFAEGVAYARLPDGQGEFLTATPTVGVKNQ